VGTFQSNKKHGKGKYTYPTGEVFEGNWVEGVQDGVGIYRIKGKPIQVVYKKGTLVQA
jgi:hypothetical protein